MSLASLTSVHEITIKSQTYTRGAGGGKTLTLTTVGTKRCRIQPLNGREREEFSQPGQWIDAVIYFDNDPQLDEKHIIEFEGDTFEVIAVRDTDRLGRLWAVDVEKKTDKR